MKNDEPTTPAANADDETTSKAEATAEATTAPKVVNAHTFSKPVQQNRFKRIISGYWDKKLWTLPLTLLVIIGALLALPMTRYDLLGLFIQKDFVLAVVDSKTGKPVTNAAVEIGDANTVTDNKGHATVHLSVGETGLSVTKKYYKSVTAEVFIPVKQKEAPYKISIQATGRQVPLVITNKITGKPLANALVKAADAEGKTDNQGKVTMVLPADKKTVSVIITANGYNEASGTIQVTEQMVKENSYALVPVGKVYFLSKLSGKIDVVKTNLDGSGRQTVLAGTGREEDGGTILLASRDWKYLALTSRRDGGQYPKIFLIDTSNDKLTTMDEGDASFSPVGWSGHRFVYQVFRNGIKIWQPKRQAVKSFDAETAKLAILDETAAEGDSDYNYILNTIGGLYILEDEIVYTKNWERSYYATTLTLNGKSSSLMSVNADGTGRKSIKDFPIPADKQNYFLSTSLYQPGEIYVQVSTTDTPNSYYEYEDHKLTAKSDITDEKFQQSYPTYLVSPSGKQTFWSDPRDGKSVLFVGDSAGQDSKQIATLSEYTQYGWYSDDYLFVSKGGSELYIMPAAGGTPVKVSDYHKPDQRFIGYGYGYGGI